MKEILSQGYGILPNVVLFDPHLSSTEKLLYVLVSSLCAEKGFCWANNHYFAEKLFLTKTQISLSLKNLKKYIKIENGTSSKRIIRLTDCEIDHKENLNEPLRKLKGDHKENLKDNSIRNITKNNICETSSQDFVFEDKLAKMEQGEKRMQIIALYWKFKNIKAENKEQYSTMLKRELRSAGLLAGYELAKIKQCFGYMEKVEYLQKWTLETTLKFIDDMQIIDTKQVIAKTYGTTETKICQATPEEHERQRAKMEAIKNSMGFLSVKNTNENKGFSGS